MKAARLFIPEGDPGIESTLREMRRIVLASAEDPAVIEWAQDVVRWTPERDPDAMANAFLAWSRNNVRYTEDPIGVESVKTPEAMLRERAQSGRATGDCDDQVTLIASGLNAVGVPTEFVVMAADPSAPNDFSHVLLQYASPRSGWVTMDPIVRGTGLGYMPSRFTRIGYFRDGRLAGTRVRGGMGLGGAIAISVAVWWLFGRRR